MGKFIIALALQFILLCTFGQSSDVQKQAAIEIFNSTGAAVTTVIEVPTGSLASPGLINWNNVHLEFSGKSVPFAIREGKAHWKATLSGVMNNPRPEDLLVFSLDNVPAVWSTLSIVKGSLPSHPHLVRRNGSIEVTYPEISVSFSEKTGTPTSIVLSGDSLLLKPMHSQFFEVVDSVIEQHGSMNPGNTVASISLKKGNDLTTSSIDLMSSFSNDALTELNFIFKYKNEISVGVTYRIYPSGQVEIISDERPWKDKCPWLKYGLENSLLIAGKKSELDGFQSYFPYYGFKDYASAVKSIGEYYEGQKSTVFVFGEESLNGRFWKRKLKVVANSDAKNKEAIISLLSEGAIVRLRPVTQKLPATITIKHTSGDSAIARILAAGLLQSGVNANLSSGVSSKGTFTIELSGNGEKDRMLEGDGFRIDPAANGISIIAANRFGLYKAVSAFLKYSATAKDEKTFPLIASNPVVGVRGGGFGGGPHEVDFPYGDEAEWHRAIDGMMMSGMNSMTDLGMWSNWKMPVSFKYMPELRTNDPNAYDEVSGARFSAFDSSREFALKLISYIHSRGGKVWLWVPVGAVPVTFEEKFPEATVPGKSKVPQFMHPAYRRYLESYFKELLETYPLDGFVLIRDDNGGIDDSEEFKKYLAGTKTKDRVWEQYIVLHKIIRGLKFNGTVAVYPYFDLYTPSIEELIPKDMVLVGHGTGYGTLSRNYEKLGTMGDTWLDNLFTGFRIPSTGKMKRLLSDRGSYWIGGAYTAMELSWDAIGYFGWEPTASVNSFRYDFGTKTFGESASLEFISFSQASDNLWEIMNGPLFPPRWFLLSKETQDSVTEKANRWLVEYKQHLSMLKSKANKSDVARWIKQAELYGTYFNYHLQRANLSTQIQKIVLSNSSSQTLLPESIRTEIISLNKKIYDLSAQYDEQIAATTGNMLAATLAANLTKPFQEMVYGYVGYNTTVDQLLTLKQFDATMKCTPDELRAGEPFSIRVDLTNKGFMPWMKEHGFQLKVVKESEKFSLQDIGEFVQQPVVFGDTISVLIKGTVPKDHGSSEIKIALVTPFRDGRQSIVEHPVLLKW